MGEPLEHHGLVLKSNPAIRDFLAAVASSADRPSFEICSTAREYMATDAVPYMVIRDIWMQMEPSRRPQFYSLLAGVTFVLASPKPREKSKELKDRLRKLQEAADRKAYDSLVRDIALKEEDKEYFSSYKDQLGFGLHVIVTMFTGYLVGYATFRALFGNNPVMNAAGGIFGLVSGMLLETVLFIIRNSRHEMLSTSSTRPEKAKLDRFQHKKSL